MTSYWLRDPYEPLATARHAGTVDVAVVGGGVTGLACALALARAGRRVRVHEAREVATGASGRNGGFALRGGAMPYDAAREWLGADAAAAYWRWTEAALQRMLALGGDAFARTGSLRLAADDEERDELRGEFEALREDGFAAEWRDDLPGRIGERFPAAIFHAPDASVQPARWVRRLARAAAEAGVEIREHERVDDVGRLDAELAVVATDGYPSGLLGELEGSIIPTRGQMLATEPLAERVFECPHYGRHGFDYWQQTPDGRILAGGFRDHALDTEFTADETTTEPIQEALERFVGDVVGRPVRVEQRWAGIFGLVLDFLPVVGPHPHDERIWVAGGYSGHGNVLGFACGEAVAAALLGDRDPLLELFRPERLLAAAA
ncbi:MAG: NAD(P)/FAD-dependent oxidoreductase [Pseudomonadota bacterium]